MHPWRRVVTAILATCLATVAAHADPGSAASAAAAPQITTPLLGSQRANAWKPRAWRPPAHSAAAAQGLRVAIDPVDGSMSMPTDEGAAPAVLSEGELPPLVRILHADGTVQLILDDRFLVHAVASMSPLGVPVWSCVEGALGIEKFLLQPARGPIAPVAPAVKWEER